MYDKNKFIHPDKKYRTSLMSHAFDDLALQVRLYNDFGYAGVVTNVPTENGFTSNPVNIERFAEITDFLDKSDLSFWIYDESGYPSGRAGGLTLDGHPELQAKGFFMHRRIAFEPTHTKYFLPDEADKIIWAAKYRFDTAGNSETVIDFGSMRPIPFSDTFTECELDGREIMYVFCVKNAYEGSHSTHNVCSHDRNINIMDKKAVEQFINRAYQPIADKIPDAFMRAVNVFTDEPSLQTSYVREDETWPFALAPYCDELFEKYEKMHGRSLLPYLPHIFEGGTEAYPTRIRFYRTVGQLIAEAYSGQLSKWCKNHGCGFSGHYLCEENISQHIRQYGDFIRVLMNTDTPGIDILACLPEIYDYETAKYAQIVARKKNVGLMVELCPFLEVEKFKESPFAYMKAMTAVLALSGVRHFNSYFKASFAESYKKHSTAPIPKWASDGYGEQKETVSFNEYVGRICYLLDGLTNACDTFVYYPYEDAAAKQKPTHSSGWNSGDCSTQKNAMALSKKLFDNGFDFYYADSEDIENALVSLQTKGFAEISGNKMKNIFIPAIDVISEQVLSALKTLENSGVKVIFADKKPDYSAENGSRIDFSATVSSVDEIIEYMYSIGGVFNQKTISTLLRAKFNSDNGTLFMLVNPEKTPCSIDYNGHSPSKIYDPDNGLITDIFEGDTVCVPPMQAIFVLTP